MIEYIEDLAQTKLFSGIPSAEIPGLIECIHARRIDYAKGDFIVEEGRNLNDFGIILSGRGQSVKWDAADRLVIITLLKKGSEIGVMLAASPEHKSPVSVQALDEVSVLRIPYNRILVRCSKGCPKHERLLRNYIAIVAEKGLILHERIDCLLKPTVRDKILTYLLRVSHEQKSRMFSIPMNRNAMADYLNVERSALSRELSRMKRDKLIEYHRNSFKLI